MNAPATHPPTHRIDLAFRALSDPTRLRILNLLRHTPGELCVCDLVTALRLPQAKVSRHLAYLRRAGLVRARKAGLWSHYRLTPAQNPFHAKLLECLACCFTDLPQLAKDTARLARKSRCAPNCCDA